jgi:hypothetical protein
MKKAERERIRAMFDGLCAYCGHPLPDRWHVDHVEPVLRQWRKEGKPMERPLLNTADNMMPACPPCNIDKHAMSLEGWRAKLSRTLSVLGRNSPTYRHAIRFGLLQETDKPIVFYFEQSGEKA